MKDSVENLHNIKESVYFKDKNPVLINYDYEIEQYKNKIDELQEEKIDMKVVNEQYAMQLDDTEKMFEQMSNEYDNLSLQTKIVISNLRFIIISF